MSDPIQTQLEKGVGTITLNQPEKHNAFDDLLIKSLSDALDAFEKNNDCQIIKLQANGKSFCAGADLQWMRRMINYSFEENKNDALALAALYYQLNYFSKPVIAAIEGNAFGGGVGLIACCDIAIASSNASFCFSEVKLGLSPSTISPYVIAAIGERNARRYFLTAELFSSEQALAMGLLHEVVSPEKLAETVQACIDNLLKNSPSALLATKQLIFDVNEKRVSTHRIDYTAEHIAHRRISPDAQARLKQFLEKK